STRINRRLNVLPGKNAALRGNGTNQTSGKHRDGRHLPIQNVSARLGNNFLPRLRQRADRDLIPHGASRDKETRFTAEHLRGATLKRIDSWVFAVNIVA